MAELSDEGIGLVDIRWVAQRLGVIERFVRRLIAERRIPYIKIGGRIRFDPADVERLIEASRRPALNSGPVPVPPKPRRLAAKARAATKRGKTGARG